MKYAHPFDARLADSKLFGWFGPMFEILGRHWLVAFAAAAVTAVVQWLVEQLPWPIFLELAPWYVQALHTFCVLASTLIVAVLAYRLIAQREGQKYRVGDVNEPLNAALRATQIAVVWIVFLLILQLVVILLGKLLVAMLKGGGAPSPTTIYLLIIFAMYGWPIVICVFAPFWVMLGTASSLSQAHAARSLEGPISVVWESLRLVFGQKWRIFGHAFIIGAAISLFIYLEYKTNFMPASFLQSGWLSFIVGACVALNLAMTFVIERVYAPDLGIEVADELDPALATQSAPAAAPSPGSGASAPASQAPAAPAGQSSPAVAAPAANAPAVADLIENELRVNRTANLVELTERGVAADPKFFATHVESTVALAKRLVQLQRTDLALRVLQPYIKEQRSHRLHLTGSLLAAELLSKDPKQLGAASRFLAQLKVYYPEEPMVDRLIRLTEKAMAAAAAPPKPPAD